MAEAIKAERKLTGAPASGESVAMAVYAEKKWRYLHREEASSKIIMAWAWRPTSRFAGNQWPSGEICIGMRILS